MPRPKQYQTNAERQRAHRARLAQHKSTPPLPHVRFETARRAALESLHEIEQIYRADDKDAQFARNVIFLIDDIEKLDFE
jgi:hypothetical protein